ncbi:MAG: nuclear transport factor 2 family protein [Novosphingobium sp.]
MIDEARFEQLERKIQGLQDRQDILDCIVREVRGRDRQDVELTRSAFWEDALDEHGLRVTSAVELPEDQNAAHAKFFKSTSHNLANHTCEIDGDVAHCETYVIGAMLLGNLKATIQLIGRYIDRLERRGGEWRIARRRTIVDTSLQGDASFLTTPMVTGFPKGLWTRDDPSYQRPLEFEPPVERW